MRKERVAAEMSDSDPETIEFASAGARNKRRKMMKNMVTHRQTDWGDVGLDDGQSSEEDNTGSELSASGTDNDAEHDEIPLGQVLAIKQNGSTSGEAMRARARALRQASFKRGNKHTPSEMPSKKPVPVFRETLQGGKREVRDPRFSSLTAGPLVEPAFKKRYSFLFNEKLPAEKRDLQEALKKTKSVSKKAELKSALARVTQQLQEESTRQRREAVEVEAQTQRRAARAAGNKPFYLKKSEVRRQELIAKYEDLKKSGRLEKFLEKRRKKNAAKDHRYLPSRRQSSP